ncbi:MAG: internal scaffolding protein [Microvirus sp.]|nr:MAG: internal scaffolding protein [Microvirus sp.]
MEVTMAKLTDFYKTSGVRADMDHFDPGMTRQEFAEECDINTIMARYEAGGAVSHVNRAEPTFLDTTLYPGLQASMDAYRQAALSFAALPAKVRREFDNDPQQFVDFAVNPDNVERMREWGLASPAPVEPPPVRVQVAGGRLDDSGLVAPPPGLKKAP